MIGKLTPEAVKAIPLIVAPLTVTGAVPVDDSVTDWVAGVLSPTLPKARVAALTLKVGPPAANCSANVWVIPFALAVNVTVCAVLSEETMAPKDALLAPAGTFTVAGTVTALLLLLRLAENVPLTAVAFSVTVQLSVPVEVIELLEHANPFNAGSPVPLSVIKVVVPDVELLVRVNVPVVSPARPGSN